MFVKMAGGDIFWSRLRCVGTDLGSVPGPFPLMADFVTLSMVTVREFA